MKCCLREEWCTVIAAHPPRYPSAFGSAAPAPYQRGPPQEYLEAVTNKRLTEEVFLLLTHLYFYYT